jgi:alkaline phosphatase D
MKMFHHARSSRATPFVCVNAGAPVAITPVVLWKLEGQRKSPTTASMSHVVCFASALGLFLLTAAKGADDYATSTAAPVLPAIQPGPAYLQVGPMLGHVSATDARIWVKATGPTEFSVTISDDASFANPRVFKGEELVAENAFAGHATISELKPGTRYFYTVFVWRRSANSRPFPSFVTAPVDGTPGKMRFAFGSCVGKEPWLDAATWADLEARVPVDFVLLLGDNHYANSPDPIKQRAAFVAHRLNPGFRALTRRMPLYGIWDDHDFGPNDSDGTLAGQGTGAEDF